MTLEQLHKHYIYNYYAASKAIGISYTTMCNWRKKNGIPFNQQCKIEEITGGKLKANIAHCGQHQKPA
jgi:hypothetical protein